LENYDSSIGHLSRGLGTKVLEARKALKLNLSGMLGGLEVNIFFLKNQKTLNLFTSLTYFEDFARILNALAESNIKSISSPRPRPLL
jgi:hypothetical protein